MDSNAYIKLVPIGAGPVRRLPPALGTGAGPAATGRAGALRARPALDLRARLWPCKLRARPWPRLALRFIVKKHLLIYDVHMYQCIDIHWRFFL